MKKITLLLLYCFSIAGYASELKYRQVPLQQKINRAGQTFALTFDTNTSTADHAAGNSGNIGKHRNLALGLRGILGFDHKNAYLAEKDEVLKFSISNNLKPTEGTVTFWVRAQNFNQNDRKEKRSNIGFFEFSIGSEKKTSRLMVYDYNGFTCATWLAPLPDQCRTVKAITSKFGIRPGEYYQVAVTWNLQNLAIYINGELGESNQFPASATKVLTQDTSSESYFAVRPRIYDDKNQFRVEIDDLFIYNTVKSPAWIQKNYQNLLTGKDHSKLLTFDFTVNGIDRGTGGRQTDSELEFDLTMLENEIDSIEVLSVTVTDPTGKKKNHVIQKPLLKQTVDFSSILPGKYEISSTLKRKNRQAETLTRTIMIPDNSFFGNQIGREDVVPQPWQRPEIKNRSVSVWNRVYEFGQSPFLQQVTAKGKKMLVAPPMLKFKPAVEFEWIAGKTSRTNCEIILSGHGKAENMTAEYHTKITFDGVVITDITFNGSPEIKGLDLEWQVEKRYCKYLKTPFVTESLHDPFKFSFDPVNPKYIHLTSREGGFAFNYDSDANWIYTPEEKIFSASRKTGKCLVNLITKPVRLPEKTSYRFIFTATPTRPFPEKIRGLRMYDYGYPYEKEISDARDAFTAIANFNPAKDFDKKMLAKKSLGPGRLIYYSMADAQIENDPVVKHYQKYWNIPFRYRYPMGGSLSCSTCTFTGVTDYLLANQIQLWKRPLSDRFCMVYYDLCDVSTCQNPLHGCAFKDRFGRTIFRNSLLSKRDLILRTLRICQKNRKQLMLHGQRHYYPPLHGLADYWFPGEEHGSILRNNNFGYTDEILDIIWEAEFDRDVLGTAVVMTPTIGYSRKNQIWEEAPTYALMAAVLPYDIEIGGGYRNTALTSKVMNIYEQLGVYGPSEKVSFHRFDMQKELISSNPECRISYYRVDGKRTVAIVANTTPLPMDLTVCMKNGLFPANGNLLDCLSNELIPVKDRYFKLNVPSRNIRILTAYEGKKIDEPLLAIWSDYCQRVRAFRDWNCGKTPCVRIDFAAGKERINGSALVSEKKPDGVSASVELEVKADGIGDTEKIWVSLQPRKKHKRMIRGLPATIGGVQKLTARQCRDWKKIHFQGKMPVHKDFSEVLLVLGGSSSEEGHIFFRNIKISGVK